MAVDLKEFKKKLAENKVYDAWQYVESLKETLGYMSVSYDMLVKVHEHRVNTLKVVEQDLLQEACSTGKASCKTSDLEKTNLNIGGYILDDTVFLRKTSMEFFHYGRISMDVLFQIVNAALLGDEAISVEDKGLLKKLLSKLSSKPEFATLLQLMDNNKNDAKYQYLIAFDNFMKHIKTILITVKNSILIGTIDSFKINSFCYGGEFYPEENALDKIKELHDYVIHTIDTILNEVLLQIPNCFSNSQRIQEIHYKQVFTEKEGKNFLNYMTFFIDVDNDLSELPQEIKVFPLIIKPNDEIYSFDFRFDKIFIRKRGSEENAILGCATLKNGLETNQFYRTFEVKSCTEMDYHLYIATFKQNYSKISFNAYAMDGVMIFIKED
ncbi:hypothetical protein MCG44_00565 [Lawsonibacter sp. OA9]|uniref:hypothetical protein n=1 Tax=Oscillospiraceae TaxID=216572 RepID=UPI001F06C11C|nr:MULTISPECIES: hypothetical protein [Oscillospiraceae]MCH1978246.1 hypothetical protein [Lawsonibacter sp. OA9]MCH1984152.1 hypothetical protein [Ruminococcus sp. OA3]